MILRRLSQSLKEQNWMAIGIEFVLLVTGVFLGIQVANWNAERVDASRGQAYLERINADLGADLANYHGIPRPRAATLACSKSKFDSSTVAFTRVILI